jgi:predicted porin
VKSFKLNLLAVSALLAAGAVSAQDIPKFEIYGVVGAGVVSADGFGQGTNKSWNGYADQLHSSNRLGFRGGKDLGDGMSVKYMLETNFATASGATGKDSGGNGIEGANATSSGPFFDREANVAIADKEYGQLMLGRGKNFLYNVLDEFDSRGNWNLGGAKPIARYAGFYSGSNVSRFDRMVRYSSPSINNFKIDFAHQFGNTTGSVAGSGWDSTVKSANNYGIRYTNDGLDVAYTNETVRTGTTGVATEKINLFAIKYQVTPQVLVNYGNAITKNPFTANGGTNAIGAVVFGKDGTGKVDSKTSANTNFYGLVYRYNEKLSFNYGNYAVTDRVSAGIDNVTMNSLGTVYTISKGFDVNVDYIRANRKSNAASSFTIFDRLLPDGAAVSESKVSQSAFAVGLQYRW